MNFDGSPSARTRIVRRFSPSRPGIRIRRYRDRRRVSQTDGGARARNGKCGGAADAESAAPGNAAGPKFAGSGKAGAEEGFELADNWISAQIGHLASANPFDRWNGRRAVRKSAPDPSATAVAGAAAYTWTWPNASTIWTASANSAKREPKRIFDRNQCIPMPSNLHQYSTAGRPVLAKF